MLKLNICIQILLLVVNNIHADLNENNPCEPCATCKSFAKELNVFDITWTTSDYNNICISPKIILLHDTVSVGALQTVQALHQERLSVQYIIDEKGAIFQQVADVHRAWHAGAGSFRTVTTDPNSHAVGIEVVNSGEDPFPDAQIQSLYKLVSHLKQRWSIDNHLIISHADITPANKMDISGYFHYKGLYDYLGIFKGLFDTRLTPAEQKKVLVGPSIGSASEIGTVQANLDRYGYNYLKMEKGRYDENTKLNMEAFNRHFCPEVFIVEMHGNRNADNQRWYQLSEERLQKLLKM